MIINIYSLDVACQSVACVRSTGSHLEARMVCKHHTVMTRIEIRKLENAYSRADISILRTNKRKASGIRATSKFVLFVVL